MQKTRIYPIFLPHAGCPFQCIYCNQRLVASCSRPDNSTVQTGGSADDYRDPCAGRPGADLLISRFRNLLPSLVEEVRRTSLPGQIAFYGGTFTALPLETLEELLGEASRWIEAGIFTSIRFSTRPDGITPEICAFLARYPIRTIELGVQSLSDKVLLQSRRGYSAEIVRSASALVREHGWELGIQMMPGLPEDTCKRFMDSVHAVIALQPAFVRVYPTLVLSGTVLADWYGQGKYQPLTLEDALNWCRLAYEAFLDAGIPVARMGLHADPELEKPGRILAGPYHPSFGYLVRVRWWRIKVDAILEAASDSFAGKRVIVCVPERFVSEALGPGRGNLAYWREKRRLAHVRVQGVPGWPAGKIGMCLETEQTLSPCLQSSTNIEEGKCLKATDRASQEERLLAVANFDLTEI